MKLRQLLAAHEGKAIEVLGQQSKIWNLYTTARTTMRFWSDIIYRVRPEPVVKEVALCYREDNGQVKNKIGTVNLVDGVVDPDSAKFDGVTT